MNRALLEVSALLRVLGSSSDLPEVWRAAWKEGDD
jgi:hypothetical protein